MFGIPMTRRIQWYYLHPIPTTARGDTKGFRKGEIQLAGVKRPSWQDIPGMYGIPSTRQIQWYYLHSILTTTRRYTATEERRLPGHMNFIMVGTCQPFVFSEVEVVV